ncbi:nucleotidyltransferase family protein [Yoonia sp.]|uniref:nucleotidyltransferase family protein n=1 Tax=Yoonia sp. TaxID=2212373 RepID=UPI002FD8FC81
MKTTTRPDWQSASALRQAKEGILPTGRLASLVRAASPLDDTADHWAAYVAQSADVFPDEGEFRIFPVVRHLLADHPELLAADAWLNGAIVGPGPADQALISATRAEVQRLLDALPVPFLWTKGSVLGQCAYPSAGMRPTSDLDLLVPYEAIPAVAALAEQERWDAKLGTTDPSVLHRYRGTELSWTSPNGIAIDLGWMPRAVFAFDPWISDHLFSGPQATTDHIPDPNWLLVEAIEHGLAANEVAPLRWVVDALWILHSFRDQISEELIIEVARRYQLNVILGTGLEIIADFDPAVSPDFVARVYGEGRNALQWSELRARLTLPDLGEQFMTARVYNAGLRAPMRLYAINQRSPFGRHRHQSLRLRAWIGLRNIASLAYRRLG